MKYKWTFAPLVAFSLAGCGSLTSALDPILEPTNYVQAYQVFALVDKPAQFEADRQRCAPKAATLAPGIDVGMTAIDTVNGGLANAPSAVATLPTAILVTGTGAGAAGTTDILKGLGLSTPQKIHSLVMCMQELTRRDLSGVVMDPS
jgi:hypothetical protein